MNAYITTTAFSKTGIAPIRRKAMRWKRKLLDVCINGIRNEKALTLKGIITPERLNHLGIERYRGIIVQSVKTTISEGDEDYERCSAITKSIDNHSEYCKPTEALSWPKYTTLRSPNYFEDNEHALLFMKMKIKTPCIIVDGDCLISRFKHLKFSDSIIFGSPSNLIYIHRQEDASKVLFNKMKYVKNSYGFTERKDSPRFVHMSDVLVRSLTKSGLGFKFLNDDENE